jgi:hypothetical protein
MLPTLSPELHMWTHSVVPNAILFLLHYCLPSLVARTPPPPNNSPPLIESLQVFLFTTPQNSFLNKHIARYNKNNEFLDTMQIKMEFKAKN